MSESTRVDGRPSVQWYPDDWLEEPSLKLVSLSARGLWMEMLMRMFKSPRRGYLLKPNGVAPTVENLAAWTGRPLAEVQDAMAELEREKVFSVDCGTIYCRRSVRDEEIRKVRSVAGAKGGRAKAHHQTEGLPDSKSLANTLAKPLAKPKQKKATQHATREEDTATATCDIPSKSLAKEVANSTPSSSSSSSTPSPESTKRTDFVQTDVNDIALDCPPELASLELYSKDKKLIQRWPQCYRAWKEAYPSLDIMSQVKKAHSWEVDNPARRKKDRPRFLGRWLARAQDNHKVSRDDNLDRDAFGVIPMPSQAEIDAISAMEARIAAKEAAQKAAQQ